MPATGTKTGGQWILLSRWFFCQGCHGRIPLGPGYCGSFIDSLSPDLCHAIPLARTVATHIGGPMSFGPGALQAQLQTVSCPQLG